MSSTNLGIQKCFHKLNKITGNTNLHIQVTEDQRISLLPTIPTYVAIPLKDPSLTIDFKYGSMSDLLNESGSKFCPIVLLSTKNKIPDEKNCQQNRRRPKKMIVKMGKAFGKG
jgi:hypothetical protein